jgi:hypothetical protein
MGESFTSGMFCLQKKHLSWVILNVYFLRRGVVSTSPNPQAEGPPLVGCPRLLILFIHSYPPYRRPFLHLQPEDVPCRGDRDPHSWINNTNSTKFLGLTLDSTLSWKTHIDQLSSKLNSACYIIRSLRYIISSKNLQTIYFSYVHSVITYVIIFWGNSPYSNNIFKLQKRAIRIIMNAGNKESCRELFKKLNILLLLSQYILSLLLFVV